MEYIIEQFNIDMRKANLYMSSAITKYEIECVESMLYESADDFGEDIFTEATEGLLQRIKQFFANLLQKIKEFFQKLVEKMREFFQRKQVDKLEKTVKANPKVANAKIKVIDIKYIEETYGKRRFLCKALEKKLKNGTLTQDDIDDAVEKYDKLGKTAKVVGITVGAALAIVTGGVILKKMNNLKNNVTDDNKNLENVVEEVITKEEKTQLKEDPATSNAGKGSDIFASFSKPNQNTQPKEDPATSNAGKGSNIFAGHGSKPDQKPKSKEDAAIEKYNRFYTKLSNDSSLEFRDNMLEEKRNKLEDEMLYRGGELIKSLEATAKQNSKSGLSAQKIAELNTKAYNDAMKSMAELYKQYINLTDEAVALVDDVVDHQKNVMNSMHLPKDGRKDLVRSVSDAENEAISNIKKNTYKDLAANKKRMSARFSRAVGIDDPMAKK